MLQVYACGVGHPLSMHHETIMWACYLTRVLLHAYYNYGIAPLCKTLLGCYRGDKSYMLITPLYLSSETSSLYTLCNTRSDGLTSFFQIHAGIRLVMFHCFHFFFAFPMQNISRSRDTDISIFQTLPSLPLRSLAEQGVGGGRLLLLVNKSVGSSFWTVLHICVEAISINA